VSPSSTEVVAVTGASGGIGGRVARILATAGVAQRLVVRDQGRAPSLPGAHAVRAAYEDVDSMRSALHGVRTLLLVSAHEARGRVEVHRRVVDAVAASGVERVVYTSFMGAAPAATFPFARDHFLTEQALRDAGVRLTALRNSLYADVAPLMVGPDDVVRGPAGRGRVAWVARDDVARVAAAALLDDAHADRVYDVSGPEALDFEETCAVLSDVLGRTIRYVPETPAEARASRAGADPHLVEGWIGSYAAVATGETSVTSHTVAAVTGTAPVTLRELLTARPETLDVLRR
jgi:NAD(P)H dehydrogenase (quinone)